MHGGLILFVELLQHSSISFLNVLSIKIDWWAEKKIIYSPFEGNFMPKIFGNLMLQGEM
jgi:hypothetical protein